jgi:hypothetical protein
VVRLAATPSEPPAATESRKRPLETDASDAEAGTAKTAKPNDDDGDDTPASAATGGDDDAPAATAAASTAGVAAKSEPETAGAPPAGTATAKEDGKDAAQPETEKAVVPREEPAPQTPTAYALKLLVSNNSAGSIIGKGGQTINMMQQQSMATIKVCACPNRPSCAPFARTFARIRG